MTDKTLTLVERLEAYARALEDTRNPARHQASPLLREAATALRAMPEREKMAELAWRMAQLALRCPRDIKPMAFAKVAMKVEKAMTTGTPSDIAAALEGLRRK